MLLVLLFIQDWATVISSSLPACAGEKLPEIEVWGAVGEQKYVWAVVGCREYQVDLCRVLTSTSSLLEVPTQFCVYEEL